MAGDFFDGTVLLLWTPLPEFEVASEGVTGLGGTPECLDPLDETDTFLRTPPYRLTLSAPALALDEDLPMTVALERPAVVGVRACGVEAPLSICFTVPSSTAVPSIPIKKWSWFSIKKIKTSWLRRYSFGAISWDGCDKMPGWKMAARFEVVILLMSAFAANTARRSRM
jgi:hypothetical protein